MASFAVRLAPQSLSSAMGLSLAKADVNVEREAILAREGAFKADGRAIGMLPGAFNATGIQPGGVCVNAVGIQPGGVTIHTGGMAAWIAGIAGGIAVVASSLADKEAPSVSAVKVLFWPSVLGVLAVVLGVLAVFLGIRLKSMSGPKKQASTDRRSFLLARFTPEAGPRANVSDPELILDELGNLASLYKKDPSTGQKTEELLSPRQVASCARFFMLTAAEAVDGLPAVLAEPCVGESGLKVNLIAGPTGSGKTSLIHIMAGGMEIPPSTASDTKCPNVYLVSNDEGTIYALLDTAGLCDTMAMAQSSDGMQTLLINAVAAIVDMYSLQVVSFSMCMDMSHRLPGNFAEIWPQMQFGLGGDQLGKLGQFVVTKANADSDMDVAKLQRLPRQDFYKTLEEASLKWPVVTAGRKNLRHLEALLKPVSTAAVGIDSRAVDPDAKSLASKQQLADRVGAEVAALKTQLTRDDQTTANIISGIRSLHEEVNNAYEELASLGNCSGAQKALLRARIDKRKNELRQLETNLTTGLSTMEQTRTELGELVQAFNKEMDDIKKMHGFGAFFKTLLGKP